MSCVFTFSCTNLGRSPASSRSSSGSGSVDSGGASSGNFILLTVLPSQQSAGSQYDMIGTGNQIGVYCGADINDCRCEYTYANGTANETVSAVPTYVESDLIRCPNSVPSGINTFTARVVTTDGVYFSTSVQLNLSNGTFSNSTFYLDLTNEASFVQVRRFQCKKREYITNPLDASMIDPLQSEDPKVIYPFNFYTTNVSESLLQMQRLGNQNWDCTLTETKDRSLHAWANPNVFSAATCTDSFCSSDNELMYPQTSLVSGKIPVNNLSSVGRYRASFWLAKQPYGVFQIPLQAAIAPKDYVSGTYGVIGYAAKPIPSQTGISVCPSITLPTNAQWVKVWNFRATDITPPKKVTATQAGNLSAIVCNPGDSSAFPTCSQNIMDGGGGAFGTPITAPAGTGLSSRVVALDSAVGNANACYNVNIASWDAFAAENWDVSPIAFGNPSSGGLTLAQVKSLPWGMYSSANEIVVGADTIARADNDVGGGADGNMPVATPSDHQVTATPLSTDNYTDQLFIVSDDGVDDFAMRNQSSSVAQYRPITYRTAASCSGVSRVGCNASKEIHWDVNVKEVGNPTSQDIFPLCVLQFYD